MMPNQEGGGRGGEAPQPSRALNHHQNMLEETIRRAVDVALIEYQQHQNGGSAGAAQNQPRTQETAYAMAKHTLAPASGRVFPTQQKPRTVVGGKRGAVDSFNAPQKAQKAPKAQGAGAEVFLLDVDDERSQQMPQKTHLKGWIQSVGCPENLYFKLDHNGFPPSCAAD